MGLEREDLSDDPIEQFRAWFADAEAAPAVAQANAMCLSTLGEDGFPQGRIVLLKGLEEGRFVFYTNLDSAKGRSLRVHPRAALTFWWEPLGRQVRITGPVEPVEPEVADAYFASRPRGSQLGAWASEQSQPLDQRATLERRVRTLEQEWEGRAVSRPPHWSGFGLTPVWIEFWQDGAFRLHDRFRYERGRGGVWTLTRLNP
ncbi:MAG: pyridoxamine 5'-phosphate oxidase [Gemmatimonadota bacterium]